MIGKDQFKSAVTNMLKDIQSVVGTSQQGQAKKLESVLDHGIDRLYVQWSKADAKAIHQTLTAQPRDLVKLDKLLPLGCEKKMSDLFNMLSKENKAFLNEHLLYIFEIRQREMQGPFGFLEEDPLQNINLEDTMNQIKESPMFSNLMQQAQSLSMKRS